MRAPPHSVSLGQTIAGKYHLERVIGSGGMGTVYEARHTELGRRIAVKVGKQGTLSNQEFVTRFRREARALAAIESEHVPQVLDMGVDPEMGLFIAMEYLEGEDLETRLSRERPLDPRFAARIGVQLARAVGKAHAAGVLHRDIKPGNVFLCNRDDGSLLVKVLDFGVSKLVDAQLLADAEGGMTGATPIGTVMYMAPEQAEGSPNIDARADVWSIGAVLFEMLSGRPVFEDRGGAYANLAQLLSCVPPKFAQVAPWVPGNLAAVVDRALAHRVHERTVSASGLAQELLEACPAAFGNADTTGERTVVIVTANTSGTDWTQDTTVMHHPASAVIPLGALSRSRRSMDG
jgi:eukaryotic-like serine/threonine-protein kinase